jgi:hypothetical protein
MTLFLFFNTQTMHIKSIIHYRITMFPKSLLSWGIRTRVPEVDAMSTAPRLHGRLTLFSLSERSHLLLSFRQFFVCGEG